jgi:hypothetical protein
MSRIPRNLQSYRTPTPAFTGELCELRADGDGHYRVGAPNEENPEIVRSLHIALAPQDDVKDPKNIPALALVRVTWGVTGTGGKRTREFHVGPGCEAWLTLGWDRVKVEVVSTGIIGNSGPIVQAALIKEQLTQYLPLRFWQSVAIGGFLPIPNGAEGLSVGVADPVWEWRVIAPPGVISLTSTYNGDAAEVFPVIGSEFKPSVVNTVCWMLRPL